MLAKANFKMNRTSLNIIAKQNNQEIYLISYKHKEGVGFVSDLEKGIRYADGTPVQVWNLWGESPLTPIVRSGV